MVKVEMEPERAKDILREVHTSLKIIVSDKTGLISLAILLMYALMAIVGPEVVHFDLAETDLSKSCLHPSWEHPLGTDYFGRDVLAMLVHGSRDVLLTAFLASLITVGIGLILGLISGFMGGKVDTLIMSVVDIVLTIPSFPLLLVLASTVLRGIPVNPLTMAMILSVTAWAGLARAIRSQALALKEENFIVAAKCLGLSRFHIVFGEVLPNLIPYIVVMLFIGVAGAIYAQVGLFMLGVAPLISTNWGYMLNMALHHVGAVFSAKYTALLSPAFAIVLLQVGLMLFANAVDKVFNPRLREE